MLSEKPMSDFDLNKHFHFSLCLEIKLPEEKMQLNVEKMGMSWYTFAEMSCPDIYIFCLGNTQKGNAYLYSYRT